MALELSLQPTQGTVNRNFPHTGYLGLTPVVITGNASTKIPILSQPLPVKRVCIIVKCYEVRFGRTFGQDTERVLWEKSKVLWKPTEGREYQDLGNWESSFRITVAPEVEAVTASSQWMKEWKAVWRLELAVEHQPIPYVGHRLTKAHSLALHNHRSPLLPPLSPPQAINIGSEGACTEIFLTAPYGAFGPGDTFNVSFHAKPEDPTAVVKKACVVLERRLEILDDKSSPKHGPHVQLDTSLRPVRREDSPDPPSRLSSLFRRSVSPRPHFHRVPSDPAVALPSAEADAPCRVVKDKIFEVSCDATPHAEGIFWCSLPVELPKRGGKWDVGETVSTKLISVTYELRLKISIKSAKPRSSYKEYACPGVPVTLSAVSAPERSEAMKAIDASPSPAKPSASRGRKHRSSRRGLYMQEGTTDISESVITGHRRKAKTPRSPTSSPRLPSVAGVVTDIKPILLPPDHPVQAQSISFVFPSLPPDRTSPPKVGFRNISAPIESLVAPDCPDLDPSPGAQTSRTSGDLVASPASTFALPALPAPSSGSTGPSPSSSTLLSPPNTHPTDYESFSILRAFQQTGRRISTTTSEEEEMQPSRSRLKLRYDGADVQAAFDYRPALPSLDALGLGLPQVSDDDRPIRRVKTAPIYSTFAANIPPPLSGRHAVGQDRSRPASFANGSMSGEIDVPESNFAFTVVAEEEVHRSVAHQVGAAVPVGQ